MMLKPWNGFGVRWSPLSAWSPLGEFHDRMNRLFGEMESAFAAPAVAAAGAVFCPGLNVWEDEHGVYCEAEIPGLSAEEVEIGIRAGELTIKGERKQPQLPEGAVWHRRERAVGGFVRTLTLPCEVDSDKAEARFDNGVLTISVPKAEAAKPKRIAVKSAEMKALK